MKIFKGYVKNLYCPEASIVERYIVEETIEFCTTYMSELEAVGVPKSMHEAMCEGKGTRSVRVVQKDQHEVLQGHLYILNNTNDVLPYIDAHKMLLKSMNPRANEKWLLTEHNKTFLKWFKDKIGQEDFDIEEYKWLARGPNFDVITWTEYDINMMYFYKKAKKMRKVLCRLRCYP